MALRASESVEGSASHCVVLKKENGLRRLR